MVVKILKKGYKKTKCTKCDSTLQYEETDVFSTSDYTGDSNNDRCITCPACGKGFRIK